MTWRLLTEDGDELPHDACPMAVAIKENRPVRNAVAIAQRPDGKQVLFTPFPTPICDESEQMLGAVNVLIDITDEREAAELRAQASHYRQLARNILDDRTIAALRAMAAECEEKARALGAVSVRASGRTD